MFFILQGTVEIFLARYPLIFSVFKKNKVSHCTQAHESRVMFRGAIIHNQAPPRGQRQVLRLLLNLALASHRLPKMPETAALEGPRALRDGQGQDDPIRPTCKPSDPVLLLLRDWPLGKVLQRYSLLNKQTEIHQNPTE